MKKTLPILFLALFASTVLFAQNSAQQLPSVSLKTLDGDNVNSSTLAEHDGPVVISFWATWCKPCILELNTIMEEYEDLVDETGVNLVAISIDDARNSHKVQPFVNGRGWEYDVFLDSNGDFKRALGVNNVPHVFVLNSDGEIVYQHNSYSPGDEEELYEIVAKVAAGEPLGHKEDADH